VVGRADLGIRQVREGGLSNRVNVAKNAPLVLAGCYSTRQIARRQRPSTSEMRVNVGLIYWFPRDGHCPLPMTLGLQYGGGGDSGAPPVRGKGEAHLVEVVSRILSPFLPVLRTPGIMERRPSCLLIPFPIIPTSSS
jgi:hypothetical protein